MKFTWNVLFRRKLSRGNLRSAIARNSDDSVNNKNDERRAANCLLLMLLENCPKIVFYLLRLAFSFSTFHNAMWRWWSTWNRVTFHTNAANECTNLIFSHFCKKNSRVLMKYASTSWRTFDYIGPHLSNLAMGMLELYWIHLKLRFHAPNFVMTNF